MNLIFISVEGPPKIGGITTWIMNIEKYTNAKTFIPYGKNRISKYISLVLKILKLYSNKEIPVFADFTSQLFAFLLAHPHKKIVFFHHGPGAYKYSNPKTLYEKFIYIFKSNLHKSILKSNAKQIFVSKSCLNLIETNHKIHIEKYEICLNGFPKKPTNKLIKGPLINQANKIKLVYAGRDHPLKNVDGIYNFATKLSKYMKCELTLCGVSKKYKSKENLKINSLGKISHEESALIIKNSDISVFLSNFPEANPLFLIESMHYGLGIVTNDNFASLETLKNYPYFLWKHSHEKINIDLFQKYLNIPRRCYERTCQDQVNNIIKILL